jgi:aquaporin Z
VMVYSVGRISGGHFNPAVTFGAAASGRLAWSHVPMYLGAQLVGAIVGAAVLWSIWQGVPGFSSEGNFGQNAFGDQSGLGIAWWAAFLVEVLTTLVFLLAILAVTDERNEHPALAPLTIGLSLSMIHFATIPLTGTSVNPARSIGANIFAGSDAIVQLWLFILAPLLGAAIAGALYPALFGRASEPVPGSGFQLRRPVAPGAVPGYGAPDAYQQQWNQQYPAQQPWPPQPPQPGQQPQYPTGQPGPQAWPQQPPVQQPQPGQPGPPDQSGQPPQAAPWQQPWPGNDEDGQTQVRPPT